jgi:uncharacterized membrane protein YphA (DoxX/SURF4 family)
MASSRAQHTSNRTSGSLSSSHSDAVRSGDLSPSDGALILLRLLVAVTLVMLGAAHVADSSALSERLGSVGVPEPNFFAILTGLTLLAAGLRTFIGKRAA